MKQEPLSTSLQQLTTTVDGKLIVLVDGEKLIKQAFANRGPSTKATAVDDNQNELYKILKTELEAKNKLIEEQQQTINKLTDALAAAQLITQAEQLLHGDTKKMLPAAVDENGPVNLVADSAAPEEKQTGFFARLFGRGIKR
jgi:tRNA G18 (ribose-2'-O)-methylase SpoU